MPLIHTVDWDFPVTRFSLLNFIEHSQRSLSVCVSLFRNVFPAILLLNYTCYNERDGQRVSVKLLPKCM